MTLAFSCKPEKGADKKHMKDILSGVAKKDYVQFMWRKDGYLHLFDTKGNQDKLSLHSYRRIQYLTFAWVLLFNGLLCFATGFISPWLVLFLLPAIELLTNMHTIRQTNLRSWHGAEHAAINAYEQDNMQAVYDGTQKPQILHKRCGTNLLVLAHMLYFGAIFTMLLAGHQAFLLQHSFLIGYAIYSVIYTLISPLFKYLPWLSIWPGMLAQKLYTVQKPTEHQLQACIEAIWKCQMEVVPAVSEDAESLLQAEIANAQSRARQ